MASRTILVNSDTTLNGAVMGTGLFSACSEVCYELRVNFLSEQPISDQLRLRIDTLMVPTDPGPFQYESTSGRGHTWVTDVSGATNAAGGQTITVCFYLEQDTAYLNDPDFFESMVHPHAWLANGCTSSATDTLFLDKLVPAYLNEIGHLPADTIYLSDIAINDNAGVSLPGLLLSPAQANQFGQVFRLRGTLVIDTTYSFSAGSSIFLDPDARILVRHPKAGARDTLRISHALVQGCLSRMWKGIEVYDDETLLVEHSVIKDAHTAITLGERARFDIGSGNEFKRNRRNVVIQKLVGQHAPRLVHDNHFFGGPLRDPDVPLATTTGVEVRGTDQLVALYRNEYRDMYTGLLMVAGRATDVHSSWANMKASAIHAQHSILFQSGAGMDAENIVGTGSVAVALLNSYALIRKNGMVKVPSGVGVYLTKNKLVLVHENRITAERYGVNLRYNVSHLTVANNELHVLGTKVAARGIFARGWANLDESAHRLHENTIDMYDFDTGIELQSTPAAEVVANTVLLYEGGNGLKMSHSPYSHITNNSLLSLKALSGTSGMFVRLSPKSTLRCNCTDGTNYGFYSWDDNHDLMLQGNSFGQHVVGIQLGEDVPGMPLVSVIGEQPHAGNTWAFPDMLGGLNVAPLQGQIKESRFTVHTPQGTPYHPWVETPNCGGCEHLWFEFEPTGNFYSCTDPCAALPERPAAQPEGVSALDRKIATGTWSLPNFPEEQRWTAQALLYRWLATNGSLLEGEPLLQKFYRRKNKTDIGRLEAVRSAMVDFFRLSAPQQTEGQKAWSELDALFAELQLVLKQLQQPPTPQDSLVLVRKRDSLLGEMNARAGTLQAIYDDWRSGKEAEVAALHALNDAVRPTTLPAANLQQVNRILIDHLLSETDSLTQAEVEILWPIASQCPLRGGEAVYQARALLSDTLQYDDAVLCQGAQQQHRALSTLAATAKALELKVWPNPADELLVLETDHLLDDRAEAVITTATGVEVVVEKLASGQRTWTLLLPELPTGLYFLAIRSAAGHTLANQRFVIGR